MSDEKKSSGREKPVSGAFRKAAGDLYKGPDRRQHLPTLELWEQNIKALNQSNLTNCQMRYAISAKERTFLIRFEDEAPVGKFNLIFPEVDRDNLTSQGFAKFVLTLTINDVGRMSIDMRGRYELDGVPLELKVEFHRDIGLGVGIARDFVSFTDTRSGEQVDTTFAAIIDETLKDGERKFARKDDDVRGVSVEGMIAILGRYLKHAARRRKILRQS